jgi:abnormal spindle-like microcephaly-associated protein
MQFLHGRLVGEGNVGRHLELLGYKLAYSQSPLMEFPFAISNLAVDLRDGLRLIKVAEVLTGACVCVCCKRNETLLCAVRLLSAVAK